MMDVALASVINEKTQINFKGSSCQKSMLMKRWISNAWVMVGVMIMITLMNHMQTANKLSNFLAPHWNKNTNSEFGGICLHVGLSVSDQTSSLYLLTLCHCHFQIWFYTNDIFKNAGITEPYIQYTTVGTGAIEVISGMLGVSGHYHT